MCYKSFLSTIACVIGAFGTLVAVEAHANPKMVVDVRTGNVIAHQEAFQKWYPASLTKLMTAYIAFKALKSGQITLETPITVSKKAAAQPASKMYYKPGSKLTYDSALKILLVKSANDVAVAIAEATSGSLDQFIAQMNREALALGMNSTRFINPHGLPGKGQYTTARDLAVLALRLKRDFPEYQSYFSLEGIDAGKKQYANFNTLIGRFDGADGMKTGFICASGFNQISSATRNGRSVISIVLGSDSLAGRADDSANLLQQGLTSPAGQGVPLSSLQSGGAGADVMDVSAAICNPKAAKIRSENRDEAGRQVLTSPYIHQMTRPPIYSYAGIIPGSEPPDPVKPAAAAHAPSKSKAKAKVADGPKPKPSAAPVPQSRPATRPPARSQPASL